MINTLKIKYMRYKLLWIARWVRFKKLVLKIDQEELDRDVEKLLLRKEVISEEIHYISKMMQVTTPKLVAIFNRGLSGKTLTDSEHIMFFGILATKEKIERRALIFDIVKSLENIKGGDLDRMFKLDPSLEYKLNVFLKGTDI